MDLGMTVLLSHRYLGMQKEKKVEESQLILRRSLLVKDIHMYMKE